MNGSACSSRPIAFAVSLNSWYKGSSLFWMYLKNFFLVFFASLNLFCFSDTLTIFPCCLCVLLLGNLNMFLFLFSNFYQTTDTGVGSKFCQSDKSCTKTSRCKLSCFLCYCETSQHKYRRSGADVTTSWGIFSLLTPCSHLRSVFHFFYHWYVFQFYFS